MDVASINAIIANAQAAACKNAIELPDGSRFALAPNGYTFHRIEALDPYLPYDIREQKTFIEQGSFVEYVKRFASVDAVIFARPGSGMMSAHLDYHSQTEPRGDRHIAHFRCNFDESWERWQAIDGKEIGQVEFAYFIEEMMHTIGEPDGMWLLEMAQHLKVMRSMVMKSSRRLTDGTVDFEFSEEDETSVKGGRAMVPDEIVIVSPIYLMRPAQTVVAKLRTRADKGAPLRFIIDILNREMVELDAFDTMRRAVAEATSLPAYLSA